MIFHKTELTGVLVVEPELISDERGFFACAFIDSEFEKQGLNPGLRQTNIAFNVRRGTVRGMHFQKQPHEQAKLTRCTRGAIYDVVVDLRPGSPTRYGWFGVELTADNRRMLYVAEGFAHGYQTLTDDAETFYQVSEHYHPESTDGVRWDDPAFAIKWPLPVSVITERDANYPLLNVEL